MSIDSTFDKNNSKVGAVVDQACREFEKKFHADPQFRIEMFLPKLSQIVAIFQSSGERIAAEKLIKAELIFVEMDLRRAAGQKLDRDEYLRRFDSFGRVVAESMDRIYRMYPDFRETQIVVNVNASHNKVAHDDIELDQQRTESVPDILGPYQQIEQINSGGFGIVCRAIDTRDDRIVALKFPRKEKIKTDQDLNMFLAEASKAMKLEHPGIVRTYHIEHSDGYLAIVQQFVEGTDLKSALEHPIEPAEISNLVATIAQALAYAHQQGIYHRDLKPANILLDTAGRPYIADFGLALNESEQIYLPKQLCGTAPYMPPEQVAGLTRLIDGRSDIWSLGVIMYELLTNRRPFEGVTNPDIFSQIENNDPRPPRQIDATIDPELQRICLKCIERQKRERYLTADELADDLLLWSGRSNDESSQPSEPLPRPRFVPKGLRSYTAEDAAFFLDLLPGPRDREGLPAGIRFWKSRIVEPVAPANQVPVGVIFGPSGSGKSSFIKAGLVPQLGPGVLTVEVEATQLDTEVRLLKALRKALIDVPEEVSLPELFRGLSFGQWRKPGTNKLLIVIDQFEQRLSQADEFSCSQLARALRFCEGEQLQCLLLTRDDFLMALSRFTDALEMDVREGVNAQAIDLFDRKHAAKILTKLARAYEQLPAEPAELSKEQELFVSEAINQLADNEYVICVRLTLFAEMFKHRPWTLAELKQVGGVAGTGEKFLEATFGTGSRDKRLRMQREPVQRVLGALLPAIGSDIRGSMKSSGELMSAAKLESQPKQFSAMINSLDGQLKLITGTDPDNPHDAESKSSENDRQHGWYQLTHDYLVPSVRGWLDSSLRKTRSGRARLRLRDLGAQVVPGQPIRILPTNLEWLAWQFQVPASLRNENEQLVMRATGRRFLRQAAITSAILLILGTFAAFAINRNAHQQEVANVDGLIDDLIQDDISAVPAIVEKLVKKPKLAEQQLRAQNELKNLNDSARLRIAAGLLPFDAENVQVVVQAITNPECSPDKLVALTELLNQYVENPSPTFKALVDNSNASPRSRFRAACAEIHLNITNRDWAKHAGMMAVVLWDEPVEFLDSWISILQQKGESFDPKFSELLQTPDDVTNGQILDGHQAFVLANALYSFKHPSVRDAEVASLIPQSNDIRFDAILSTIEKHGHSDTMANAIEQIRISEGDATGLANRSIALMRLGRNQDLVNLYKGQFDSLPTFLAINSSNSIRLRLQSLIETYENQGVAASENVNLRRSVLQALALHSTSAFDEQQKRWLEERARHHILNDTDACCFSSAELILRRLELDAILALRNQRRIQKQNGTAYGNVWINERLQAFSIIDIRKPNGELYKLAVATNETTNGELLEHIKLGGSKSKRPTLPFLFHQTSILIAYRYCNAMAEDGASFYAPNASLVDAAAKTYDFSLDGYRLPTKEEWIAFNQSNRVMEGLNRGWPPTATNYAWLYENSNNKLREVCRLLPNARGLFDTFGNVLELCHGSSAKVPFVQMGDSFRTGSSAIGVDKSYPAGMLFPNPTFLGFRVVRTFEETGSK